MLFVVLVVAVSGAAAQLNLRPYNVTAAEMFANQDKNNVGYFTLEEFRDAHEPYDYNHDHIIERHEFVCYLSARDPKLQSYGHALFDEYDSNHKHRLEFEDFEALFNKMDTNGDGHVTKVEFINSAVQMFERTEGFHLHGHHHPLQGDHYCADHGHHHG